MTLGILDRLHFSERFYRTRGALGAEPHVLLQRWRSERRGVRRFLARVGVENIDDVMKVREADRIGSGVPKAVVYKMRHLCYDR